MRVSDLMYTDLKTIDMDATVADALATIADNHISALPVVDAREHLVGVLSTTDILQAAAECSSPEERDLLFERTAVRDLMTRRPITIAANEDVREAAQLMLYLDVHRVFVESDGRPVGVLSQSDIVRGVATSKL